jgi:hypothetical protein
MKHRCNICGKTFIDEDSVIDHILTHDVLINDIIESVRKLYSVISGNGLTYYKCEICGKYFITFNSLKTHVAKHNEVQELVYDKVRGCYEIVEYD